MQARRRALAAAAVTAATAAVALPFVAPSGAQAAGTAAAPAASTAAYCGITWGSKDKVVNQTSTVAGTPARAVRAGHHSCYDRVVVQLKGKPGVVAAGYSASSTAGWTLAAASSTALFPTSFPTGKVAYTGFPTVKAYANPGVVQGVSTMAVLTRARLPFRVFLIPGPGTDSRVVIDVAHRW